MFTGTTWYVLQRSSNGEYATDVSHQTTISRLTVSGLALKVWSDPTFEDNL